MVYVLLLYSFFSLFFLFDSRYVKTLNELKYVNYTDSIYTFIILLFLSFAGIPPLLGFCSKFFLFILFLSKTNIAILIFFTIFNFFSMYFYIQNLRFLISKEPKYFYIFKNNYIFWNKNLLLNILILNFLNVFGITFIDDIMIFIHSLYVYII